MTLEREVTAGRDFRRQRPRGYASWNPRAETRRLLGDVDDVLDRYADYLPLSIRQIFYALVGAEKIDKTELAYARLCEHLNRARRARRIDFADIRDDGVIVAEEQSFNGVEDFAEETARRARAYRRDRQAQQPSRIELWCEASGMVGQLARVAGDYSIPVFSASGFASLSAVRQIADRALHHDRTLLLHVGDLDPSGESIFDSITQDAAAFVVEDRVVHTTCLRAVRVALTREQVAEHQLPMAPAKRADSRAAGWAGGTCQLEALAPDVLAGIVRDAIESELDKGELEITLEAERDDRAQLLGLPRGKP